MAGTPSCEFSRGWSSKFKTMSYCAVFSSATYPWGGGRGGGPNWRKQLFAYDVFLSI